jgi:hypothetical protein
MLEVTVKTQRGLHLLVGLLLTDGFTERVSLPYTPLRPLSVAIKVLSCPCVELSITSLRSMGQQKYSSTNS